MDLNLRRRLTHIKDQLDANFELGVGIYISALVSPAILLMVSRQLRIGTAVFTLAVVGLILASIVTWALKRWSQIIPWIESIRLAWLWPIVGAVPMFAYLGFFVRYVAVIVTDLSIEGAANVIGVVGFISGFATTILGGVLSLILLARAR